MTRADELRQRADNCEHMKRPEIAADLRQLAQVHDILNSRLLPDGEIKDDTECVRRMLEVGDG